MTGNDITQIRTDLGLEVRDFSRILNVHPATIYRWEAFGDSEVRIDPIYRDLLLSFQQEVKKRQRHQAAKELGDTLLGALVVGGSLFAIYKILEDIYKDKRKT